MRLRELLALMHEVDHKRRAIEVQSNRLLGMAFRDDGDTVMPLKRIADLKRELDALLDTDITSEGNQ